jgi:N-acetylneuraminic acid mutarotase
MTTEKRARSVRRWVGPAGVVAVLATLVAAVPASGAPVNTFRATGPMGTPRAYATATVLRSGEVLVAGGEDASGAPLASAEIFNPANGSWRSTGALPLAVAHAAAALLANGTVLLAGGLTGAAASPAVTGASELFNPASGTWSQLSPLPEPSFGAGAALLQSGQVLCAGGFTSAGAGARATGASQVYDPSAGRWSATADLPLGVADEPMTALRDGRVLVAGGFTAASGSVSSLAEIYQPSSLTWSPVARMPVGVAGAATVLLASNDVLVAGGQLAPGAATAASQVFHPATGSWSNVGALPSPTYGAVSALTAAGQVLYAGGLAASVPSAVAALYDPLTARWTSMGDLLVARAFGVAATLSDGSVLVAGGLTASGVTGLCEQFQAASSIAITSPASFSVVPGRYNSFTVTTSGSPAPTLSAYGTLPPGLAFNNNGNGTATISGTPPASSTGSYQVTVTASNGYGSTAVQSLVLVVAALPALGSPAGTGYWYSSGSGQVAANGVTRPITPKTPQHPANIVEMVRSASGNGYYLVSSSGGVFNYGDAAWYGSLAARHLATRTVALGPTPTGKGYYLVTEAGTVFAFGDASFHGSTAARSGTPPVTDFSASPTGKGYWVVTTKGNVFAFGDAAFYGSPVRQGVAVTVADIARTPDGRGYWVATTEGKVLAYGSARLYGSLAGAGAGQVSELVPTPSGKGYWLAMTDGKVFNFGDARFFGPWDRAANGKWTGFAVDF